MATWNFSYIDNGGKKQSFSVKADDKKTAIDMGFERAKRHAKGDCVSWSCSLRIADNVPNAVKTKRRIRKK